jgi:hypothetical protein
MKKLAFIFVIIVSNFVNAQNNYQPNFYLSKLFYDSISKDEFLYNQQYSSFLCKGFTITLNNPTMDPSINVTSWVYKQNFLQYLDTTKYNIVYEGISYNTGFHYEYFKIFNKQTKLVRQLMASYEIGSNKLISIRDSEISW